MMRKGDDVGDRHEGEREIHMRLRNVECHPTGDGTGDTILVIKAQPIPKDVHELIQDMFPDLQESVYALLNKQNLLRSIVPN